jgi:hypothetical protein
MVSRQFLQKNGGCQAGHGEQFIAGRAAGPFSARVVYFHESRVMQSKESAEIHSSCSPVSWEHGWKTDRVIATRYLNPSKGYNIGFRFPRNPYRGDNAVVFEFYQMHGGSRWPAGREQLVRFEGVHDTEGDTEGADRKLQEILPTVSELLEKSWSPVEFAEKTQSNQDRHATRAEAGEMQMTWAALKDRSSTTVRRFLSFP